MCHFNNQTYNKSIKESHHDEDIYDENQLFHQLFHQVMDQLVYQPLFKCRFAISEPLKKIRKKCPTLAARSVLGILRFILT